MINKHEGKCVCMYCKEKAKELNKRFYIIKNETK